jgi:hypothetical protein
MLCPDSVSERICPRNVSKSDNGVSVKSASVVTIAQVVVGYLICIVCFGIAISIYCVDVLSFLSLWLPTTEWYAHPLSYTS